MSQIYLSWLVRELMVPQVMSHCLTFGIVQSLLTNEVSKLSLFTRPSPVWGGFILGKLSWVNHLTFCMLAFQFCISRKKSYITGEMVNCVWPNNIFESLRCKFLWNRFQTLHLTDRRIYFRQLTNINIFTKYSRVGTGCALVSIPVILMIASGELLDTSTSKWK